jgi:hypothetical protein
VTTSVISHPIGGCCSLSSHVDQRLDHHRARCVLEFSATYRRFAAGKSARLVREMRRRMRASFFSAFYKIQEVPMPQA